MMERSLEVMVIKSKHTEPNYGKLRVYMEECWAFLDIGDLSIAGIDLSRTKLAILPD